MKNPLTKWIAPLALAVSALGALLRLWLLTKGYDHMALLVTSHPANISLYVLSAAVLLGLFLCLRRVPDVPSYRGIFPPSLLSAAGSWIAALGVGYTVYAELDLSGGIISKVSSLLGAASVLCLLIVGFCRLKALRPNPIFHTLVTLYLTLRLLSCYQTWNAETQISMLFPPVLASVFMMLTFYHLATLDAGSGKLRHFLFFRYCTMFFCWVCFWEAQPVLFIAMALWCTLSVCDLSFLDCENPMSLPEDVQFCIETLENAGFDVFVVGGCVRDSLLGLQPQDYDMCTNASPKQIRKLFSQFRLVRSGEKHGTIGVVIEDTVYEITTFRTEGGYSDSRHPDWVNFVKDVRADLARRDFTVNAMAYSPARGYVDPFGGRADLKDHVLRTVGDPRERFTEDPLRILRGVRFAARYQLTPHPETESAMTALVHTMDSLSAERVLSEMSKLLLHISAEDLIRYTPIITRVLPELSPTVNFDQKNPHHLYDVYTHTAHVVENTPAQLPLRWAALLHDAGKPETFTTDASGCGHFYDHAAKSAALADTALQRLKASTALREQVVSLIRHHMELQTPEERLLRRRLGQLGEETLRQLVALQKADRIGTGTTRDDTDYEAIGQIITDLLAENACLKVTDLAVDGNDLMALGLQPGPALGKTLDQLLDAVLDERIPNEKEALLAFAKENLL